MVTTQPVSALANPVPVKVTSDPLNAKVRLSVIAGAAETIELKSGEPMKMNDTRRSTLTANLDRRLLKCKHAVL